MSYFKRARTRTRVKPELNGYAQSSDPAQMDPNFLRDAVRNTILDLPVEKRAAVSDRLLLSLSKAGVKLGTLLIQLGINIRTADELTPSDIAHLVRYLRINSAVQFQMVRPVIAELIASDASSERRIETRKAA